MQREFQKRPSTSQSQRSLLGSLTCDICPHSCDIDQGDSGLCQVIKNVGGKLKNEYEGRCSNIALEPIEKRPFFHFYPGSSFLSVGFYGCSFTCDFCQNFRVSQTVEGKFTVYSPRELVELAVERKARGIAFTYNEPTIYHNYIEEVGHEIGRRCLDLKLVVKTSGFANPSIIRNICLYADAVNVDIKGDDEEYDRVCGGSLGPVLETIKMIARMDTHLEVSYLVLPDKVEDDSFSHLIADWLLRSGRAIPLHLLYFYPFYRMEIPTYKPSQLVGLVEKFKKHMRHIYISNHFGPHTSEFRDTRCLECGKVLISRQKKTKIHF